MNKKKGRPQMNHNLYNIVYMVDKWLKEIEKLNMSKIVNSYVKSSQEYLLYSKY